jgi:hypothetical protein
MKSVSYFLSIVKDGSPIFLHATGECPVSVYGYICDTKKSFQFSKLELSNNLRLKKVDISLSSPHYDFQPKL